MVNKYFFCFLLMWIFVLSVYIIWKRVRNGFVCILRFMNVMNLYELELEMEGWDSILDDGMIIGINFWLRLVEDWDSYCDIG